MNFHFHPDAAAELEDAVEYYDRCQHGLGLEFAKEAYSSIGRASEYPNAWPRASERTRRCLMNRFPFGVIYRVEAGHLYVIAIANLYRRPGYWKSRM